MGVSKGGGSSPFGRILGTYRSQDLTANEHINVLVCRRALPVVCVSFFCAAWLVGDLDEEICQIHRFGGKTPERREGFAAVTRVSLKTSPKRR